MDLIGDQDLDTLDAADAVGDILRLVRDGDDETAKIATSLICEIEELAVEEGLTSPVTLLVSQLKFGDEAQKEQAAVIAMKLTKNQDLCAAIAHTDAVEALLALIEDRRGGDQSRFATTTMANVVKCGGITSSLETLSRLLELLEKAVKGEGGSIGLDGVLETLAGLLLCADESIRCRAATLLCDLANQPSCVNFAKHIIDAGAVPALVECIQDDSDLNWAKAIKLLELLAGEKDGVLHIKSARVLAEVVKLASKEQYTSVAIRILHKISCLKMHLDALKKAGATDLVIQVAQESSGDDGVIALRTLNNLVADGESLKDIVATGGIAMAMRIMKDGQGFQRQQALRLLGNLAFDNDTERMIGAMGAIPSIIEFLRCGTLEEKEDAAFSLFNLSIDPSNVDMIMAAGGLKALLDATHVENTAVLKDALSVLSRLVTRNCDAKKLVVSTDGIPQIVKFLQSKKRDGLSEAMALLKRLFQECDGSESRVEAKGVDALLELCQDNQDTLKPPESVAIETFSENQELAQAIASAGGIELLANIAFAESSKYSSRAVNILLKLAAFPEHRAAIAASYRDRKPSANDA